MIFVDGLVISAFISISIFTQFILQLASRALKAHTHTLTHTQSQRHSDISTTYYLRFEYLKIANKSFDLLKIANKTTSIGMECDEIYA